MAVVEAPSSRGTRISRGVMAGTVPKRGTAPFSTSGRGRVAGEREPQSVRDRSLENTNRRHFRATGPPTPRRHERLRRPNGEMGDGADDKGGDHGRHADGEEEGDDRDKPTNGGRHRGRKGRAPGRRESLFSKAEVFLDD